MIPAAIETRDSLDDFSSLYNLKTCVDEIADCYPIRPNNRMKRCQQHGSACSLVFNAHRQTFEKDQLNSLKTGDENRS